MQGLFSRQKEEIIQECHSSIFQPSEWHYATNRCIPRRGLVQLYFRTRSQSCLHLGALTGAEKNYQNLERECLATIWGMEKFHYFLYGKHFMLETDQKPLASIYKKTHGRYFTQNTKIGCKKLSIPAVWHPIQERERHSTSRCFKQSISNTSGRRWDSATDRCSESYHLQHSCEFQWNQDDSWRGQLETWHSIFWDTTYMLGWASWQKNAATKRFTPFGTTEKISPWKTD